MKLGVFMKMKILMLVCLMGSFEVKAQDHFSSDPSVLRGVAAWTGSGTPQSNESITPNSNCKRNSSTKNTTGLNDDTGYTKEIRNCVYLSQGHFREIFTKDHRRNLNWDNYIDTSANCDKDEELKKIEGYQLNELEQLKNLAARCDAAAYLINSFDRSWDDSSIADKIHPKAGEVTGGIKCESAGIPTLDYEACRNFVENGQVMEVAQQAIYQGQQMYYQDKAMTAQVEASASTDTATAGIKALKTGVKGQEEIMTQRAAIDSGKFAALAKYYSEMPSTEDLIQRCSMYKNTPPSGTGIDSKCEEVVRDQSKFALLMNQDARNQMKAKLAAVGINVASDVVMAALMAKRGKEIDNAIAKIESFKPIDPLAPAADNLQTTYCQQNPGDAQCLTGGLEKTFDAMGDNIITFGEGGTGTVYNPTTPTLDSNGNVINSATPTAKGGITATGSVINSASQRGGLADTVAAAGVSKGTLPSGGGGGGGGGGSVGGGGGGGSSSGQGSGGVANAVKGKAPTYGGGSGTLSMMGGYGINKGKTAAKDDGNPFGKLFAKDASKSSALDFGRNPASQKVGGKTDNIFEMISKRYSNVSSDKRLLEYELAK